MISRFLPILLRGFIAVLLIAILISGWLVVQSVIQKPTVPRTAAERAIMDGEEAVKADSRSIEARLTLAAAYAGAGRSQDALNQLKVATRLDPRNVRAHYIMGVVYKDQGKADDAIASLTKAGALKGEIGDVYGNIFYELGSVYKQKQDYKNAIEAFKKAESFSITPYLLKELAECYEKVGAIEDAKLAYLNILQRDVENADAIKNLTRLGVSKKIIDDVKRSGVGH